MDHNDEKRRTIERHLRGARRFEERREHLLERKNRGGRRPSRMRDNEAQDEDLEDVYEAVDRSGSRSRRAERRHAAVSDRVEGAEGTSARVSSVARTEIHVIAKDGTERTAHVPPRIHALGHLVVGDEVTLDEADRVVARAERRTLLERRAPGQSHRTRLLAANVDVGLVVLAPRDDGLSLGFLDRAIAALESGGIEPRVVITKVDLLGDEAEKEALRAALDPWEDAGIAVHLVASPTGEGVDELRDAVAGQVVVLLGHSGVGKSTLVNALDPSAAQATGEVRDSDGRGRHTTTGSRLIPFVDGGALVDTPGIRQLVPDVTDAAALAASIPELAPLLGTCRFGDCAHVGEPGCAVAAAAENDPVVAAAMRRLHRLVASSAPD